MALPVRFPAGIISRSVLVLFLTLGATLTLPGSGPNAFAQDDPGFEVGQAVIVDTDLLSVYLEPSTSADVAATLVDGTYGIVNDEPVTAGGVVWYQIFVDDFLSWAPANHLQLASGAAGILPIGTTVIVISDQLNLRDFPTSSGEVLEPMVFSDRPFVVSGPTSAEGYDWYELTSGDVTGWAVRDYLAFAPQDVSELVAGDVALINTALLSLREDAGLSADAIATLDGGVLVTLLAGPVSLDGWTWFQIDTGDQTGWVAGEFLTV